MSAQPPHAGPSAGAGLRGGMRPGMSFGNVARAKNPRGTLARLASYFGEHRDGLLVVGGCIVVYTLLGLVGPYLMGQAIDRYITTRDASGLAHVAVQMLAAYLASNLFQGGSSWLMAGISQRALKKLRSDLFRHLQTLPMDFFERNPSGELMSRLTNDIDAVNQAVAQNITSLLASVLSMVGI
ncbi:MAG: ABC transporter transmembrane domain-containing protein, partial [Byssovorax sp.]